jgi:4-cresol dehydrogenase (hydroxylating)
MKTVQQSLGAAARPIVGSATMLPSATERVSRARLGGALRRWQEALGEPHVLADAATLQRYGRSTLPDAYAPLAVVQPATAAEVQQVVRVAAAEGIPLYPISRGKNWGYGDACPGEPGHVIVDLGRMNRIIEVDAELGYAVVEPGVTQGQLYEYLRQHDLPFVADCTGAGPDASVVGNTLERGFGHTPYGDHALNSCGMEVVLASGELLRTGLGHFPSSQATHAYRWGLGPYLDGLFAQSSLGIVTRLGVWLLPRPELVAVFVVSVKRDDQLEALVDALRPLRLDGTLRSLVHIGNDLRMISAQQSYPWREAGGQTPLPPALRRALRRRYHLGAWMAVGALYGTRQQVAAARRRLKRALRRRGRLIIVGPRKAAVARLACRLLRRLGLGERLGRTLDSFDELHGLLHGRPTTAFFQGTLWRSRGGSVTADRHDPLDHDAGLIWLGPVLPMRGRSARELLERVEPIFARHRFDPCVTISLITERALVAVMNISFDKSSAEETERARRCYRELLTSTLEAGFPPYRLGSRSFDLLPAEGDTFWEVVGALKDTLDPKGILARGRYRPRAPHQDSQRRTP